VDSFIKANRGFTLIELIVAVAILGVVASIGLAILPSGQAKARDAQRKQDLQNLKIALEVYFQKNGSYPGTSETSHISDPSDPNWIPGMVPTYTSALPVDPKQKVVTLNLFERLAQIFRNPPQPAYAAITMSYPPSSKSGGLVRSLTWSHTVGAGSDRILVVGVSTRGGLGWDQVNSVTYNGISLTRVGSDTTLDCHGYTHRVEIWYLVAPPTGTYNVVITTAGNADIVGGATSWIGVNQTNPVGTFFSTPGTSLTPTINVNTK
jgi:prepilin-type N-terminal cleavage/methylation domain-containing protein